jgi:phosphoribosyl-ATP pyrophosphohydrolase
MDAFERLMATLRERAETMPVGSYTTKLLQGGVDKIGSKILEESREVVEAAAELDEAGRAHFIYEVGDLIYHTMVMMAFRGVQWSEVEAELARREGVSGLEEKRRRGDKS